MVIATPVPDPVYKTLREKKKSQVTSTRYNFVRMVNLVGAEFFNYPDTKGTYHDRLYSVIYFFPFFIN